MKNINDIEKRHQFDLTHTVKCKCGHSVTIYNRYRREICSFCGRNVFLTKKDEYKFIINKMLLKER